MYSPPFRALSAEEDGAIVEKINEAAPDFVWVGLGAPKQEIWMHDHQGRVQGLMVGVGAAFDYTAGNISRAPQWMQKHNLEWLYRLTPNGCSSAILSPTPLTFLRPTCEESK